MATGWEPNELSKEELDDGESYHRALYHGGDLGSPANWHKDSVERLIDLSVPHINEGSLVVDYGSGTGGSAIELLKVLDKREIPIDLVLVDPLVSWFGKAREILGEREGLHFELSIMYDGSGRTSFRRLEEILDGRKADLIISSSTMHLIPAKTLANLAEQFANSLKPGGLFIWDSGDLECKFRPSDSARLHDPYRAVRDILREDDGRKNALSEMSQEEIEIEEKRLDRIFPPPLPLETVLDALAEAGFSSEISERVVDFSNKDAERFAMVPRLSEIAWPLMGEERSEAIKSALQDVLREISKQGMGDADCYRSHWVYGKHRVG